MDSVRPALEFRFACPLTNGLHARPASALAEVAARFSSECRLRNLRNGAVADLRSVLAIIAAEVRAGDECVVTVSGPDEESACAALHRFVERELPACDEPPPATAPATTTEHMPRALQAAGIEYLAGAGVSPGVGWGKVVFAGGLALPPELPSEAAGDPAHEQDRIRGALVGVRTRLEARVAASTATTQAILKAHLALLTDPSLTSRLGELTAQGRSAGQAVVEACASFVDVLRRSETPYLRTRALDLQDVCQQLLEQLSGPALGAAAVRLTEASVVVAENLTPQQLLALDRAHLQALVLQSAGATSHTVILARSLAVPTVAGVPEATSRLAPGQPVLVDAGRGIVMLRITSAVERFYRREQSALARRRLALARYADAPGVTADGRKLEVAANVSAEAELEPAFAAGADGIGVFRTEMLFAGRPELPSEEEQFQAYARAARAAGTRPVVIRTLDVGGDKPLPYLDLPREPNPFLGLRGVRLYQRHREVIRAQVRAILRASALGRIQLMVPMVSGVEEVRWVRAMVAEVQQQLKDQHVAFDAGLPVGIMLEVPSACFLIGELSREVDFFSLGTNDLAQYFFAADRDNPSVAALASPRHPAFLRFLAQTVAAARRSGKWIGLCGEMAADPAHLPLMLGLGVDEISVPPPQVALLKERLARLNSAACAELLQQALRLTTAAEVDALLASQAALAAERPLIDSQLVLPDSDSASKEEAIREIIDAIFVAGRTQDRDTLETALWAREAVYSTGLGHGFAIPHCKSDAIEAASIGVLRLRRPLDWGSLDGEPVRMVVLLALRERDAGSRHLQVFARLARKMMSEEFRAELMSAPSPTAVVELLRRHLEVPA